jgi:RNA polymerase sigma factor (sigma-70 family)
LEASALTQAGRRGLLARRSPLLRLQGDERLVAMLRRGNDHAFEVIVDRYQARLLGFCRQMLGSTEDAEDVLQEVFVNAYRAMRADEREIKLRPWLYRIARNRCLNHLRKPVAEGKDSMDNHPIVEAASTHERVQNREEFRQLLTDVGKLPETQRSALLLREMDAMSYEDIAQAMQTTVPSVKSLLVRARIALAEASQARLLTCGEVRLQLAEAAEGLGKASGPVRRHLRECDECGEFREQLRSDSKVLAALFPVGPLLLLKGLLVKVGIGGAGASSGAGAASAGGAGAGAGGAALGGGGVGAGAVGGAIGAKAVAGVVTAAVLTAGAAVEVKQVSHHQQPVPAAVSSSVAAGSGGVTAPTVSYDAPAAAPAAHPSRAHRKALVARQAKKDVAPQTAPGDDATATDPAATTDPQGKHKHSNGNDEAGASATEPAITVTVTQTPPATTTVTTTPVAAPPAGDTGTDHQPPPPPPPASDDPPPPPPPSEEPPPPSGGDPQPSS